MFAARLLAGPTAAAVGMGKANCLAAAKDNVRPSATCSEHMKTRETGALKQDDTRGRQLDECEVRKQKAAFEAQLASGRSTDPLRIWTDYVKWTADHLPNEKVSVMAQAIKALTEERYHDDIRLLRIWCRFAIEQDKAEDYFFFGSLDEQGIGSKHSLLYEVWASALENKHKFQQAAAVYQRGLGRKAKPFARLRRGFVEFLNRMERRQTRETKKRKRACSQMAASNTEEQKRDTVENPHCQRSLATGSTSIAATSETRSQPSLPNAPHLPDVSHWASRKLPAGRHSHRPQDTNTFEESDCKDVSSKRRRVSPYPAGPLGVLHAGLPMPLQQASLTGSCEAYKSLQTAYAPHSAELEGLAAIGEQLLEQRRASGQEHVNNATTAHGHRQGAESMASSGWSVSSWLGFGKRTC